jgi:hypothetical protein
MPKRWSIQMTLVDEGGSGRTARSTGERKYNKTKAAMSDRDAQRLYDAVRALANRLLRDD